MTPAPEKRKLPVSVGGDMFTTLLTMKPSMRRGGLAVSFVAYLIELEAFAKAANPKGYAKMRRKALELLKKRGAR